MSHIELPEAPADNPINIVEQLAVANEWNFERSGDNQVTLTVTGKWSDYTVSFDWMEEIEVLHLTCGFDLKIPDPHYTEALKLAAALNEQIWFGHYDLWRDEGMVLYRSGIPMTNGAMVTPEQCQWLLQTALSTTERHYPAFQFVVWAGKTAKEARDAVLFETAGEA
jgi:hypothetical protein